MLAAGNAWQAIGFAGPAVLVASLIASWALIALLLPLFQRYTLALPNVRSSHAAPTPQGGGIAVVAATLGVSALAVWGMPQFDADTHAGLLLVIVAALLLAGVGMADDMHELGAAPKLVAQAIGVGLVIAAVPADMQVAPFLPVWLERVALLGAGLWLVNLVNFMDGIDWMMVAEIVPVTAGIAIIGALGTLPPEALIVALALNGAMLGFAPFNRPVARLFLGDMGSLPIGLLLVWLLYLVAGSGHLAAAILLPLYFIADATITLLRRLTAGERIWQAHRTHFYQRARSGGMSTMDVVVRVFAVNCGLAALAVVSVAIGTLAASVATLALGAGLVAWLILRFASGKP